MLATPGPRRGDGDVEARRLARGQGDRVRDRRLAEREIATHGDAGRDGARGQNPWRWGSGTRYERDNHVDPVQREPGDLAADGIDGGRARPGAARRCEDGDESRAWRTVERARTPSLQHRPRTVSVHGSDGCAKRRAPRRAFLLRACQGRRGRASCHHHEWRGPSRRCPR